MPDQTDQLPPAKPTVWRKVLTAVDIVSVRLRFILLMVVVGVIAAKWDTIMNYYDRWTRPSQETDVALAAGVEYFCGMHPSVVRDQPGKCPICGMPLTKRAKTGERGALPEGVLAQVQLTPQKVAMGRIGTSPVTYQMLTREVRTVGAVGYDETRRAFITSRIKGRLDKLLVNFVGQKVSKGDPLAEIYSPDLLVAQEELLTAVRSQREQKEGTIAAESAKSVVEATRKKLSLWGITDQQVEQVIAQGSPQTHLTLFSPISGIVTEKKVLEGKYVMEGDDLYTIADLGSVWMQAKVFESEIQGIDEGTAVEVTATAYPNEIFAGRITFVAYIVDPQTRTVEARVEIANPAYKLKPGMFVTAIVRLPVGKVVVLPEGSPPATQPMASALPQGLSTHGVVHAYLALAAAYAQDKSEAGALADLVAQAATLSERTPGLAPAADVAAQTKALEGKDLEGQRQAFKAVSDSMIQLLRVAPAEGMSLYVARCPMAKADWITASQEIVNPYKGSDMLTCGSITGPIEPAVGVAGGASDSDRFATGYYCPVYPDRLYEKPEHCPIDEFELKFVRVEKVLAVPESAIIDSGTRKIAYRETTPGSGTFDMIQLKLGARAGEFFPVVSGLQAGDRVATQGAFLVDAENRLNPNARAQYVGGSNPQSGQHQH
jgi:RND family efflux transporter MFP subunit